MIMSKKLPDLTGEHFGRWTVIEYAGRGNHGEFADKYGLAYSCLYERLKLGWSIEEALLTPSRKVVKA